MKRIFMIMALLSAAASFSSCDDEKITDEIGLNADFYITSDKDVIQSNGDDAAVIKVFLKGEDITSKATIYDGDSNPVNLPGGRFTATADGEYKFWASYGTYSTFNRNYEDNGLYTVKAISQPVPASVADPQPANTGFVHRAFLTQYTGTSCGYCPYMIKIVKSLVAENIIPTKAVLAAAHSGYNSNDAAAINKLKSPSNYPYLQVDLVNGFTHNSGAEMLKRLIDNSMSAPAKVGISVTPAIYKDDMTLVVTVSVKAAEAGMYNIGAWLLEDDIYSPQDDYDKVGDDSYDTHNNCVRIADSDYMGTYFGRLIGNMNRGDVVDKTFVMKLDTKWTKKKSLDQLLEDLHLAVFVSYGEKSGNKISYSVCNAVDCPIDVATPFEYVK